MTKVNLFCAVVSLLSLFVIWGGMCFAAAIAPNNWTFMLEPASLVLVAAGLMGLMLWKAAQQQRDLRPVPVPKQRAKSEG